MGEQSGWTGVRYEWKLGDVGHMGKQTGPWGRLRVWGLVRGLVRCGGQSMVEHVDQTEQWRPVR